MSTRLTNHFNALKISGPLQDKPNLLMLSHCLPCQADPVAKGLTNKAASHTQRAWQLLSLVSRSYQVYLACFENGPINLAHWRQANAHCQQISLQSKTMGLVIAGKCLGLFSKQGGHDLALRGGLGAAISHWQQQKIVFDTVLCTLPVLVGQTAGLQITGSMICDLRNQDQQRGWQLAKQVRHVIVDLPGLHKTINKQGGHAMLLDAKSTTAPPPLGPTSDLTIVTHPITLVQPAAQAGLPKAA